MARERDLRLLRKRSGHDNQIKVGRTARRLERDAAPRRPLRSLKPVIRLRNENNRAVSTGTWKQITRITSNERPKYPHSPEGVRSSYSRRVYARDRVDGEAHRC